MFWSFFPEECEECGSVGGVHEDVEVIVPGDEAVVSPGAEQCAREERVEHLRRLESSRHSQEKQQREAVLLCGERRPSEH